MNFTTFMLWVLDGSGFYNRQQWAEFLSVLESDLQNWTEEGVPRPEKLRMMRRILTESHYPEQANALKRFCEIEAIPLYELTDRTVNQFNDVSTLAEFVCLPPTEGLKRRMVDLTVEQRERVINAARREIEAIQAEAT